MSPLATVFPSFSSAVGLGARGANKPGAAAIELKQAGVTIVCLAVTGHLISAMLYAVVLIQIADFEFVDFVFFQIWTVKTIIIAWILISI